MKSKPFKYVREFWDGLAHLPPVSAMLATTEGNRSCQLEGPEGRNENIRAVLLFRRSEEPTWDNPKVKYIYQYPLRDTDPETLNALWEEYNVNIIGESWSPHILGMRILDRSKKKNVEHRMEIWCSAPDDALKTHVEEKGGYMKVNG